MTRRIIFLIILLAAAGAAAWYFYFKPNQEPVAIVQDSTLLEQPEIISRGQAISPVASHDGNKIWYWTAAGVLKRYELATGQETEYAGPKPPGETVTNLIWPIAGNNLIFETQSNLQKRYHYFNSQTQTYVTLPEQIVSVDWLNDGMRIVYVWRSTDNKFQLVTADANGSGYRKVADLPWGDLVPLASPAAHKAILYRPVSEGPINKVYIFDLETGKYEELASEGWATGAKWSPDGQKAAITLQEAGENKLYMYDVAAKARTATGISANIGPVAFSKDGLYMYAISGKFVYKFNTQTGEQSVHKELPGNANAKSVVVLGQEIFYLSFDGMIKSIR